MKPSETSDFISHPDNRIDGDGAALLMVTAAILLALISAIFATLSAIGWAVPTPLVLFVGVIIGIFAGARLQRSISRL